MSDQRSICQAALTFIHGEHTRPPLWYARYYEEERCRCINADMATMLDMQLDMRLNARCGNDRQDFLQHEIVILTDKLADTPLGLADAYRHGDPTEMGQVIDVGMSNGTLTQSMLNDYFFLKYRLEKMHDKLDALTEEISVVPVVRQKKAPRKNIPKVAGRQWPKVFIDESLPIETITYAIRNSFDQLFRVAGTDNYNDVSVLDGHQLTMKDFVITLYFLLVKYGFSPWKTNVSAYRDFMASAIGESHVVSVQAYSLVFKTQQCYQCGLHELTNEIVCSKEGNDVFMDIQKWNYWMNNLAILESYLQGMPYFEDHF